MKDAKKSALGSIIKEMIKGMGKGVKKKKPSVMSITVIKKPKKKGKEY